MDLTQARSFLFPVRSGPLRMHPAHPVRHPVPVHRAVSMFLPQLPGRSSALRAAPRLTGAQGGAWRAEDAHSGGLVGRRSGGWRRREGLHSTHTCVQRYLPWPPAVCRGVRGRPESPPCACFSTHVDSPGTYAGMAIASESWAVTEGP